MNQNNSNIPDYDKRLAWFLSRIGKKIFRNKGTCECEVCKDIEKNGLVVSDENHAHYLNDVCVEMGFTYCDNKKDVKI